MPDFTRSDAACMAAPRRLTRRSASANERQPAKWTAVYSPRERPGRGADVGQDAALAQDRDDCHGRREDRGLRVGRQRELLRRPLEAELREVVAEDPVGLVEDAPGRAERRREVLAHADGLGALAGKEKSGRHASPHQRMSAEAHVSPAPKATSEIRSPDLNRPRRRASSSASGTLPADVLPYRSRLM